MVHSLEWFGWCTAWNGLDDALLGMAWMMYAWDGLDDAQLLFVNLWSKFSN